MESEGGKGSVRPRTRGSLVRGGQVRWRARAAAPGAGSSWTRWAPGRVRQEAEGPEGLGCGPKRDEGGPVTGGGEGVGLGAECKEAW